jgi:hypothetical protein
MFSSALIALVECFPFVRQSYSESRFAAFLPNSYKIAYKLKFSSFNWITSNTQENNVNNKFSTLFATLLLSSSLALVGCGSSGDSAPAAPKYTGTTSAAKVDSTNAEALGTGSGEATQQGGTANGGIPTFASIGDASTTDIEALSQKIIALIQKRTVTDLPTSFSEAGSCGGSFSGPDSALPASGAYSITLSFNNYCDSLIDPTLVFSGKATFYLPDVNDFNTFTMQFINFKVTENSQTTTLNMTMSCAGLTCSITSDFKSSTGDVHRVADIIISGDATFGFIGTMTFYHADYGSVSVSVSGITYGSCGVFPDGGTITYNGTSGSTGSISFASNCTYSGTYDDGAGGTGVFSGTTI